MSGLLFFKNGNEINELKGKKQLTAIQKLEAFGGLDLINVLEQFSNYKAFNRAAYNASYIASNENYGDYCGAECYDDAYQFCNLGNNGKAAVMRCLWCA